LFLLFIYLTFFLTLCIFFSFLPFLLLFIFRRFI
jgi:hypothetical protein